MRAACGARGPFGDEVISCPRRAVQAWDVQCPADPAHNRQVDTCLEHELAPGLVGCIVCLQGGREVALTFRRAASAPPGVQETFRKLIDYPGKDRPR